jgi:hypothetical protein
MRAFLADEHFRIALALQIMLPWIGFLDCPQPGVDLGLACATQIGLNPAAG